MAEGCSVCACIFQIITLGMSIATIVLIANIYYETEKNPLEELDSSINWNNYSFVSSNNVPIPDLTMRVGKYCQCGEETLNGFCTEEQIISGCYDISKKEGNLLRRLDDDINCDTIRQDVKVGSGYAKAFELNYDMVHKMALGLLIVIILVFAAIILMVIGAIGELCCEGGAAIIAPCIICIICIALFSGLVNFILFIILMVNYYKGKTTGEFLDYYNKCQLSEKERNVLRPTFEKLDHIDSMMTAFVTLNFIQMFLNCIGSGGKAADKKEK